MRVHVHVCVRVHVCAGGFVDEYENGIEKRKECQRGDKIRMVS